MWRTSLWFAVLALLSGPPGFAAGPRWVTGPPYFTTSGQPVVWYTDSPQYYTDPGDLSATVNHAAADALVAAAAGVWNVPTSRLVVSQGGSLNEHVSQANVYPTATGVVFPADVQASNGAAKQIAVIYDRDGSVTDLLLGVGASDPSSCRQSGVTESVDSITPDGFIRHALLVLNGRCTGSAPEMQLQLQYQLMRAFGRVLGLGWSQTNDNVFTGTPAATYQQALHWPIMHPIDVVCGPYTYQCLPQPFTLRDDDLAALALLYFIPQGQAGAGKTDTLLNANRLSGHITFQTGQGMQGVNVTGRRLIQYRPSSDVEGWQTVSSVSGFLFRRSTGNAVVGSDPSLAGSMGTSWDYYEGWYQFSRVPMLPGNWQWVVMETEPINPLYVGAYAVGPYADSEVLPSGQRLSYQAGIFPSYADYGWFDYTMAASPASCAGPTGTESAPLPVDASGWWSGQLCGYGKVAWSGFSVRANRSFTVEVTAQDEQAFATNTKAMPVIGVWRSSSAMGSSPDVAATDALNGLSMGMTSLQVTGLGAGAVRLAIADKRGDGRPDFNFGARVLYADSVSPASVSANGGVVTISGTGFRAGNVVTVNGVSATVQSWTPTAIVATVPASNRLVHGTPAAMVADVVVQDVLTGGSTTMSGALGYAAPQQESMGLVSVPGATTVATVASASFAVRITEADGVTPVAGEPVTLVSSSSQISGSAALFGTCGAGTCTVVTDTNGIASSTVMPLGAGSIVLSAIGATAQVSASFSGVAPVRSITPVREVEYVAAGAVVGWPPQVVLTDNSAAVLGVGVVWTGSNNFGFSGGASTADASGMATMAATLGPLEAGVSANASACAWRFTSATPVCAGFEAVGVAATVLQVEIVSGAGQAVPANGTLGQVVVRVTDGVGHPVAGAGVTIRQTSQAGVACPAQGRCPSQPVLSQGQSVAVSDGDGLVSVVPMQVAGVEVTNLVVTAGTQGFVSLTLSKGW